MSGAPTAGGQKEAQQTAQQQEQPDPNTYVRDPMEGYRTWVDSMTEVPSGRKVTYEDDSTYVGQLTKGDRHGRGIYTLPSGSCYKGEFHEDQMHGYAKFTMAPQEEGEAGEVYEGEFRDGGFHGAGQYCYADGGVYLGEWDSGMMHGFGRYFENTPPEPLATKSSDSSSKNADAGGSQFGGSKSRVALSDNFLLPKEDLDMTSYTGAYYEGNYWEDEKHGEGLYISGEDDGAQYQGEWYQGKMHGYGIHHDSKGNRYEGEFEDNLMHGQGVMSLVGQDADGNEIKQSGKKSSEEDEDAKFEAVVAGRWIRGNRVDDDGNVLHANSDPMSSQKKANERATKAEDEEKQREAEMLAIRQQQQQQGNFRHKDSRVVELPDEE